MRTLPEPVQNLIESLSRLPGIGPKTASRLAFFLLRSSSEVTNSLADALREIKSATGLCEKCFNITLAEQNICDVCASSERDESLICVVEEPLDVIALERTGGFNGCYHVLHGTLSPIEGIGPDDIKIAPLIQRLSSGKIKEIILATNPSMEGDATAYYLNQRILPLGIKVTRLARGLPVGSDLEYADQSTLMRALTGRQDMDAA
ncbi:MAG: recombination mediator RecR [Anaerolineaceae bacterium]|nr:recombination mediator RecR [Anaerolineaceae bacterium]